MILPMQFTVTINFRLRENPFKILSQGTFRNTASANVNVMLKFYNVCMSENRSGDKKCSQEFWWPSGTLLLIVLWML